MGLLLEEVAQQPAWQVVGQARVGTACPGRRSGAHDPDRRPDLRDDRRARHLVDDALSGVGDPQRPTEVADCAGEPPVAVERQQPARHPEIDRVPEGTGDRKRVTVSISALYSSACGLSGEPSTAMSAIGSTKLQTAHARGSSPRRAMSGPKMRSLGSKKDWAGGRNGRQCAAVMTRRSPAHRLRSRVRYRR